MKNLKNALVLLFVAVFAVTVAVGCEKKGNESTENENPQTEVKANTTEEVIKDRTLGVFQFTNTSLVWENGSSLLETTITNTSDQDAKLQGFKIHVYDAQGNEMITMDGFVGDSIGAHESRTMSSYHYEDLTSAARVEYEVVE